MFFLILTEHLAKWIVNLYDVHIQFEEEILFLENVGGLYDMHWSVFVQTPLKSTNMAAK